MKLLGKWEAFKLRIKIAFTDLFRREEPWEKLSRRMSDHPPTPRWGKLPINSRERIKGSAAIIARPQVAAFRIESIMIDRNPEHWIVDDIQCGNLSQFVQAGSIQGTAFRVPYPLPMETLQVAMDLTIYVRYIGPDEDGERFYAHADGKVAV